MQLKRPERAPRVAVVTYAGLPNLAEDDHPLLAALRAIGLDADPVVWDNPSVGWDGYALVLIRSPWDYPAKATAFRAWHAAVARRTPVANSPAASARSISKRYLVDLAAAGAPMLPTVVVGNAAEVPAVAAARGWETVVVKPAVGLGGHSISLVRGAPHATVPPFPGSPDATYCVQPFVASVATEGEYSVVCIAGRPSHAVRKRPARGGFEVHERFGGTHERHPLTRELSIFAEEMLDVTGMRGELVARYDALRGDDGQLLLLEMDLFGPCLYLCHHPEAAGDLARAVKRRIRYVGGSPPR